MPSLAKKHHEFTIPLPNIAFAEGFMKIASPFCAAFLMFGIVCGSPAQQFKPNYDEAKVPKYTLPDPLVMLDGTPGKDAKTWTEKRRPEILNVFEEHAYGRTPARRPRQETTQA